MENKQLCYVTAPGVCPVCVNRATCKLNERKYLPVGQVVMTSGVRDLLAENKLGPVDLMKAMWRHECGDWGEVSPEDAKENDLSVSQGFRVLSAYTVNGTKLWVVTESDRSATTVLLPDEY